MQFLIEYLRETTEEYSVCSARAVEVVTLDGARTEAWRDLADARRTGATGFQIRDTRRLVVAIEDFDTQVGSATVH